MTPSYAESRATLRCIKKLALLETGSAVCGSDGQWIIDYPNCEGTHIRTFFYCMYFMLFFLLHIINFVQLHTIIMNIKCLAGLTVGSAASNLVSHDVNCSKVFTMETMINGKVLSW